MIPLTDEMRGAYLQWQKDHVLLNRSRYGEPGTQLREAKEAEYANRQRVLASIVRNGPAEFARYLREVLGIRANRVIEAPSLPRRLTPSEFRNPSLELEVKLAQALSALSAFQATQPLFWTVCHIQWLEDGQLDRNTSDYLLGHVTTGKLEKDLDRAMRNLMRRLGGLHPERGKVSVLSDCPVARAWWRARVANEVSGYSETTLTTIDAHTILHAENQAWATLVGGGVKRVTVINHPRARAAILSELSEVDRNYSKFHGQPLSSVISTVTQSLAQYGLTRSLPHQPWDELSMVVKRAISTATV